MGWRFGVTLAVPRLVDVQRALGGEGLGEGAPAVALVVADDVVAKQATGPLQARGRGGWMGGGERPSATSLPWPAEARRLVCPPESTATLGCTWQMGNSSP